MQRLGVFGGTFDPPHLGHLAVARAALDVLALDVVVFVPAGRPWQKLDDPAGYVPAPAEDRFAMTSLTIEAEAGMGVDRLEIDRPGPSYTADTLAELASPERDLFLVLGADAAAGMPTWHRSDDVAVLATIAVVDRAGAALPDLPDGYRVERVPMQPVTVSATDVRRRFAEGETVTGLVTPEVEAYVREHGLYGSTDPGRAVT